MFEESPETDILESWQAKRHSELLAKTVATMPQSYGFDESPPASAYADFDTRRYPIIDSAGLINPILLDGSLQLAMVELKGKDPTLVLLDQLAAKHQVGIYSKAPTPNPWCVESVKRFRELYSPEPQRQPTLTIPQDDFEPKQRIRVRQGAPIEAVLSEIIVKLESLRDHTQSAPQRLGVESAIRLLRNGARVLP
jgi:hypothetical protein